MEDKKIRSCKQCKKDIPYIKYRPLCLECYKPKIKKYKFIEEK